MYARSHSLEASRMLRASRACALLLVACIAAFLALVPGIARASEQVVRVGYPVAVGYETGGEGEHKEGWGYEYLQMLAYHTGWTYEYVYGDFSDLLDMLAAGQIDLLGNVTYTEERAERFLYSTNPQGAEKYYICVRAGDTSLASANPQVLQGKKVGVIAGVYQAQLAQAWIEREDLDTELVEYPSNASLIEALTSGEIDAVVNTDTAALSTSIPTFYIGSSDYYFAVAKDRADLLAEVNEAIAQIVTTNPHYNEEVRSGNPTAGSESSFLTAQEQEWVESNESSITLGYLRRALPYSALGGGDLMDGAITAFADELESSFDIAVETKAYDTTDELLAAVKSGEVDAAVPLCADSWLIEQEGLAHSDSIATAGISLLTLSVEDDYLDSIGSSQMNPLSSDYLELLFTNRQITSFDDTASAIDALLSGQISSLAIPTSCLDTIKDQYGLDDAVSITLPHTMELCTVLAKGRPELLDILNKAIGNARNNVAAATLSHYSYADTEASPLVRFFAKNAIPLLVSFIAFLLVAVACLTYSLHRAQMAESKALLASKAKTNFLNRMSHDIRTPLNGIIGLLQISELHPEDTAALAQDRAKEQVAANHLLEMLNDVLEMGRLEDTDVELDRKPFDMRETLQDVLLLTKLHADECGVTLVRDGEQELPYPHVVGSATSLRRILLNLLSNAVKYNRPGGQVAVSLRAAKVEGGVVTYRISVADNGIGMSEEFLGHIFEPFSQERTDARSTYQGNGMGMPIVKGLVQKMGGTISVTSTLGKGSTFVVEIPFDIDSAPQEGRTEETAADVPASIEGMRILLVEDNELNREIACGLLEAKGAVVDCAQDGREAVERFCSRPEGSYDVILMDVMMPVMNGYDAARAIRLADRRDATTVPIVALTANAFLEDVKTAHDAGMNDHISKPIDIDAVARTLVKYRR